MQVVSLVLFLIETNFAQPYLIRDIIKSSWLSF